MSSCSSIESELQALRDDIAALDGRFALKSDLQNYILKTDRENIIREAYTQIYNAIILYITGLFNPSDDLLRRVSQLETLVSRTLSQLLAVKSDVRRALELARQALINPGIKGDKGDRGLTGEKGLKGDKGDRGLTGEKGLKGDKGDRGLTGERGLKGEKGDRGLTGERGLKGEKGDRGLTGEKGLQGDMGLRGLPGLTGERGIEGIPGKPGMDGQRGIQGQRGERGIEGIPGRPGLKGEKGERGLDASENPTLKRRLTLIENYINQIDAIGSQINARLSSLNSIFKVVLFIIKRI